MCTPLTQSCHSSLWQSGVKKIINIKRRFDDLENEFRQSNFRVQGEGTKMERAVRCPYCVLGFEFRRMVAHVDGRHICNKCGHTTHLARIIREDIASAQSLVRSGL